MGEDVFGPGVGYAPEAVSHDVGRTPLIWLWAAIASALIGGGLAFVLEGWALLGAWFLAGPAAFGLVAFFANRDNRERSKGVYGRSPILGLAYWGAILLALAAVFWCAYQLALFVGKL